MSHVPGALHVSYQPEAPQLHGFMHEILSMQNISFPFLFFVCPFSLFSFYEDVKSLQIHISQSHTRGHHTRRKALLHTVISTLIESTVVLPKAPTHTLSQAKCMQQLTTTR
jgi:hypothetical protein